MAKSTFFKDFKAFISKGNILDMAVGVVVGGAFSKIVTSLVSDIITPLISLATGQANLSEVYAVLDPNAVEGVVFSYADFPTVAAAKEAGFAVLSYGNFIQTVIDFILIALSIFIVLRIVVKSREKLEKLRKKEEEAAVAEEPAPAGPTTEELLAEIRDMMKKDRNAE